MNVTDGDRERAEEVWSAWIASADAMDVFIAEALAEERERVRAPFLRLIEEEAAEAEERGQFYAVTVEVPMAVGAETIDRIFMAVSDAAYEAQPEQRDWDVFVHGCGPAHQDVPLHFLRRAAEATE